MPVNYQHREYKSRIGQWLRCRHASGGSDDVKNQGALYLPMLGGQKAEEYDAYRQRALYFGATKRTVQGLLGAIFRKDPSIEYPDPDSLEHISREGDSLFSCSMQATKEILKTGRIGIFVDVLKEGDPYLTIYIAEDIPNWREEVDGERLVLNRVVLREDYEEPGEDEFSSKIKTQYRVLELVDGVYQQRLFRKPGDATDYIEVAGDEKGVEYPLIPKRNGLSMNFIPFVIVNAYGLGVATEEGPLLDLVDVNLSHYRTSADYEHGAHYTALPTAWVAGFPKESVLRIGSSIAWVTEDTSAHASFLEYTGQGLGALEKLSESKEKKMAVLGARLLEDQKKAAETAETVQMRLAGESGALTTLVRSAGEGLKKALVWIAEWRSLNPVDINFTFNTDFMDKTINPQLLVALMGARQSGEISQETFLYNLEQGELLRPGVSIEEEIKTLDLEAPTILIGPEVE